MRYRLGTRGSKLALAQCEEIKEKLQSKYPQHSYEVCVISTKGDRVQNIALDKMNDKGIFVKEIETQLKEKQIDIAIHSLKDMPTYMDDELCFVKTISRADRRDVLVLKSASALADLTHGATIATGSIRRKQQLLKMRKDLNIIGIRGNIDTRLQKMDDGAIDGIVLAAAGLHRLGLHHRISEYFSIEQMVPACGQGAIALQVRKDDIELQSMLLPLCDERCHQEVAIERMFLKLMNGGCHEAIGASCTIDQDRVFLHAVYGDESEQLLQQYTMEDSLANMDQIAAAMSDLLKSHKGIG